MSLYQESEIVSLLMAIGLTPVLFASARRLRFAGESALKVGLSFMLASYVFTVAEGYYLPDIFNLLEHATLAGAAVAICVGIVQLGRHEIEQEES